MPLLSKRRVIAAKIETTHGTPASLTTTDAFFGMDVKISADIGFTARPDDATLGQRTGIVGAKKGKISFKLEIKGSGTPGTSAHWGLILLPALGLLEASGVWSPTSLTSNHKTLTIGVYEDGLFKSIYGAMGNAKIEGETGKPLYLVCDFEGIWAAPVDAALVVPEADTVKPPAFIGATCTLGGALSPVAKFSLDLGNKVTVREDITSATGYAYACLTERSYTGKIDPEATLVATRNVWNEFVSGTEAALALSVTGVALAAPKAQFKMVEDGERSGIVTHEIDYQLNKSAAAGDDELTITF